MLEQKWEKLAENLVNTPNLSHFLSDLNTKRIEGFSFDFDIFSKVDGDNKGYVFTGYDTRESSVRLVNALQEGITLINGKIKNFGIVTTP
jgi:phosphomannomutase